MEIAIFCPEFMNVSLQPRILIYRILCFSDNNSQFDMLYKKKGLVGSSRDAVKIL